MQFLQILYGVLNNIALLLSMVVIATFLLREPWLERYPLPARLVLGLLLSVIGVTIMYNPVQLSEGVFLDTRSILISISGLFFGAIPTLLLALITAAFRIANGGAGALTGVLVILTSALIGLGLRYWRKKKLSQLRFRELLMMGLLVHVLMLVLFLLIPLPTALPILKVVSLPVLLLYPVGTALLGLLLRNLLQTAESAKALTESENRYRSLFFDNQLTMLILDPLTLAILEANPAAEKFYGWSAREMRHMRITDINLNDERAIIEDTQLALRQERTNFVVQHRLASGEVRDLEIFTSPIVIDGQTCLYSISHDITERCKLQRQTEALNRELEIKVREANAANAAKSQFLANMSHEMRTPLNGIMGMNYILLQSGLTEEQQEYAQTIGKSADILLATINDVLDLARIESGQVAVAAETFSLKELLETVHDIVAPMAHDKGLKLSFQTEPDVPDSLIGDFSMLRQVLLNLVANAVKFTSEGTVTVTVNAEGMEGPQLWLRVSVKDTGIGIDPVDFPRLFEKFQQLDNSNSRQYQGSGLGLAICQNLLNAMGGQITVSSVRGQGSEFAFIVPLSAGPQRTAASQPVSTPASGAAGATPKSLVTRPRVLVVEDNAINQRIMDQYLRRLKVERTMVDNGRQAVDLLASERFDLVLLDIQMPVMDGMETTRYIRDPQSPVLQHEIPLIALTAHAIKGDAEKFLKQGMNDYLSKPVLMDSLQTVLARWLPS